PKQNLDTLGWRAFAAPRVRWLCKTYLPRAAKITTVSLGIADQYRRDFKVDPTLVTNATPHHDLPTRPSAHPVRLVHSGGVAPQRRLDIMIRGVRESKADVTLDLYLVNDENPLGAELRALAEGEPRIRFRDPVPYQELVR